MINCFTLQRVFCIKTTELLLSSSQSVIKLLLNSFVVIFNRERSLVIALSLIGIARSVAAENVRSPASGATCIL